jgi:hypothetical protein
VNGEGAPQSAWRELKRFTTEITEITERKKREKREKKERREKIF